MGKRLTPSVSNLYSEKSLLDIRRASRFNLGSSVGDLEFSAYHQQSIQDQFVGLKFDFLAVSVIDLSQPNSPDTVLRNIDKRIVRDYQIIAPHDTIAPRVYANPGRIIHHIDIMPQDEWDDDVFYREHCQRYDIHKALMLTFVHPTRRNTVLSIEYLGAVENKTWCCFDHRRLELASFPFALAWMYRKGVFDETEIEYRFMKLADFSETKLTHLRKFVNASQQDLDQQAEDLGLKKASLKDSLYATRDQVAERFKWDLESVRNTGNRATLRPLAFEYSFLSMLGDPTRELLVPN